MVTPLWKYNMATPVEIQAQIERGWAFFSDLMEKDLVKKASGCGCCGDSLMTCLYNILISLRDRIDLGVYDDTTDKLYTDMMEIIGAGTPEYGPTVDAGPNQSISQPETSITLEGTVTEGDNPIDQIMWVQVSGPSQANIVDPTQAETDVTDLVPGNYIFKLSAIDTANRVASDTTTVSVVAAGMMAYYWNQDDNVMPDISDILMKPSVPFVSGQPIIVPFVDDGYPRYSFVAYLQAEPVKTIWADTVEFWNNGVVGEPGGLFSPYASVDNLRVTVTQYPTQFEYDIRFQ